MESIYYVLCWHCHRRCKHCYETRFRPYVRDDLESVVAEAEANAPHIVANLPDSMQFKSADEPGLQTGRIIISGGDVLTDPVRERVLYPTLEKIRDKYRFTGGVNVVVQTTGDLLTPAIIDELLARDIWSISVSGMDDYHVGMEGDKKNVLANKIIEMLEAAGLKAADLAMDRQTRAKQGGPVYSMFGATDDSWIGKLWPRGRAWENGLSHATLEDNFCNNWSGGLNFLNMGHAGAEVSVDPSGDVYPCCIKTASPLGNLVEEPLVEILEDLRELPSMQAINAGKPEHMGKTHGWDEEKFLAACHTTTPAGDAYSNLCIGCDRFYTDVLGEILYKRQQQRRNGRLEVLASDG